MKMKLILTAALTLCAALDAAVYAEDTSEQNGFQGRDKTEFTEVEEVSGHEIPSETAYMNAQDPVSDEEPDSGIRISDSFVEMEPDSEWQLDTELLSEDIGVNDIIWSVSDPSVIQVSEDGLIQAVAPGRATVTVHSKDMQFSDECEVQVLPVYSESVEISHDELVLVYGRSARLTASITPSNATNKNIVWSSGDESIVKVDQSGKITTVGAGIAMITARAADDNSLANCIVTVQFTDVADTSRYYYEPVYWALRHDITTGYGGNGKFSPDTDCTREQIITYMWRVAGCPEPNQYTSFTDVKKSDWYYKAVSWAAENRITYGLNDGSGKFGVGLPCTREMCVTFLYRAAGSPAVSNKVSFRDVTSDRYYYKAICWAYETEITTGLNDGSNRFGIGLYCSRAMVVSFLYRQFTGLSVSMDTFEVVKDASGRSYRVYKENGQIVKKNFRLYQTYYQVDPKTGEIIHEQQLFRDDIYFEGIDISEHNGQIDLSQYQNGFVIIRVAWGTNTDVLAKRNMDLCEQLKIPYGVYVYSYAINDEQAESEADYVLDLIKGRDIKLGVWFDIEDDTYKAARISGWPNASVISRHCTIFCDKVAAAGYHTGIYTSQSWFDEFVKGLNRHDRWSAHWGMNDGSFAVNLNGKCSIHQFTSIPLDRNVFYTDPNLMIFD